jgi:hypothetical protein
MNIWGKIIEFRDQHHKYALHAAPSNLYISRVVEPATRCLSSDIIQSFVEKLEGCSLVTALNDVPKGMPMAPIISLNKREVLLNGIVVG